MYLIVVYNTQTGKIITTSTIENPEDPISGGLIIFLEDGKQLVSIDVSDPDNPVPIFEDMPTPYDDKIALDIITGEVIIND